MSQKKIQDLIAQGRVEQALETAKTYYQSDIKTLTQINALSARYSTNESDNSMGILSRGEYTKENNQIVFALLNIASKEAPKPKPVQPEPVVEKPEVSDPVPSNPVTNSATNNPQQPVSNNSGGVKMIELFLASSSELKDDRNAVEIWVNRENNKLIAKGIFLKLNLWEDFLDAMSQSRLQGEYNKAVVRSDIFISLYATKVGKYTEEEFDVAYNSFKQNGKPKYIYTYFKNVQVDMSSFNLEHLTSLKNFQKKLSDMGHFYTRYNNTEDLLRQLDNQLDKILSEEGLA